MKYTLTILLLWSFYAKAQTLPKLERNEKLDFDTIPCVFQIPDVKTHGKTLTFADGYEIFYRRVHKVYIRNSKTDDWMGTEEPVSMGYYYTDFRPVERFYLFSVTRKCSYPHYFKD